MTATRIRPATAPPTTGSCTLCPRTHCESRAGTAEDWACRAALAAGLVSLGAPEQAARARLSMVDQIAVGRCPCAGCEGSLGASDYPSWRRCVDCRCDWKHDEYDSRRRAVRVRGRCREEER